jgi:transcriptional regulator with XRE-family HTH domain
VTTLKEQRIGLGMSQSHVAFLLGTQQANISAYESGALTPGSVVEERMAELLRLHEGTAHTGTWLGTCASHARAIKEHLLHEAGHGPQTDLWLMRYVIGMNDAFRQRISGQGGNHHDASTRADVRLFLAPPQSTGDHRADALLAGMAVHWARSARLERSPAWTRAHHLYLDEPWWLGVKKSNETLKAQAFANGVPSLRARGIFLDRRTFESV